MDGVKLFFFGVGTMMLTKLRESVARKCAYYLKATSKHCNARPFFQQKILQDGMLGLLQKSEDFSIILLEACGRLS